jgi:hypothetical protein
MLHANSSPRRVAASPPHQDVPYSKKAVTNRILMLQIVPYSLKSDPAVTDTVCTHFQAGAQVEVASHCAGICSSSGRIGQFWRDPSAKAG